MTEFEGEENKHDELRKLANIATDMELSNKLRNQAVDQLGEIGTHESLLILLNLRFSFNLDSLISAHHCAIKTSSYPSAHINPYCARQHYADYHPDFHILLHLSFDNCRSLVNNRY